MGGGPGGPHGGEVLIALAAALPLASRLAVLGALAVPIVLWLAERAASKRAPRAREEDAESPGREYYFGFVVGRHLRLDDLDGLMRHLRRERYQILIEEDRGGEKVFVARNLPRPRGRRHDLEAGLLSGALMSALRTRFEVEEERCAARGDAHCRFVAVKG